MKVMIDKLNEVGPYTAADWGGSVQLVFPDLGTGWLLKSENASAVNMTKNSVIDWVFPPVLILATLISTNSYNGLFNDCAGILGDNDGMKSILVLEDVQNSALSIAR